MKPDTSFVLKSGHFHLLTTPVTRPESQNRSHRCSIHASAIFMHKSRSLAVPLQSLQVLSRMRTRSIVNYYSVLSVRIGSVDAARQAGTIAAIAAATKSSNTLPPIASGSMTGV